MVYKAIITSMSNHHYRFNQQTFRQIFGGPIGDILAQASAKLVMIWWDLEFGKLLKAQALIKVSPAIMKRYVDDFNVKTLALPPGTTWDRDSGQLQCRPLEQLSREELEVPKDQRTATLFREMADHVHPMFKGL